MAATDLISMLQQSGSISAIASQLGVSPEVAEQGATALLPAVVGGFSKHADNAGGGEGGLGSLIGMLGAGQTRSGGNALNEILGQLGR